MNGGCIPKPKWKICFTYNARLCTDHNRNCTSDIILPESLAPALDADRDRLDSGWKTSKYPSSRPLTKWFSSLCQNDGVVWGQFLEMQWHALNLTGASTETQRGPNDTMQISDIFPLKSSRKCSAVFVLESEAVLRHFTESEVSETSKETHRHEITENTDTQRYTHTQAVSKCKIQYTSPT